MILCYLVKHGKNASRSNSKGKYENTNGSMNDDDQ